MDEGTYSDADVARLLQEYFVAVKVDRDEHPEIDRRFQRQVSALTGEGGWPLTAFLTPNGEAFLGGTYFPPQDGLGRPGFRRLLKEVARIWKEEPDKIRQNTKALREALDRARATPAAASTSASAFLQGVRGQILQSYDRINGGFGFAPKFPHPTAVRFLFWDSFATGEILSATRARETLHRMADGGMYDQIGGGFHRYSVDEGWHIPHFEKMAADNAPLLDAFVEGARWFGDERFRETVTGVESWLLKTLQDPAGGFGTSQDADNAPGDDGSYFTWSRPELKQVLDGEELRIVSRFFGVGADGRMPHDPERNVLYRLLPLNEAAEGLGLSATEANERLESAMKKLRGAREKRPEPTVDRAMYASINGGIIRALIHSSQLLANVSSLQSARKSADRFLSRAYDSDRGVAHRLDPNGARGYGLLEDQAEFALGLLELAGATLDPRYVEVAERLLSIVDTQFRDPNGLLMDLSPKLYDGPTIGSVTDPTFSVEDNPHLSANAASVLAFERLASLTNRREWRRAAERTLKPLMARLADAGLFAAGTALAAGLYDTPPARVVIEGEGSLATELARAAAHAWHPDLWIFRGTPPPPFSLPDEFIGQTDRKNEPRALVCFGTRCLAPVTDPTQLPGLLRTGGRGPLGDNRTQIGSVEQVGSRLSRREESVE
jgi:uncharacterized protein YyaL (SSP411 family)